MKLLQYHIAAISSSFSIRLAAFLIIFTIFSACEDFITLEPETSLSSAVAFDNVQGIEAGLNGAYSVMHSDWVERQYVFAECLSSNVFEVNQIQNSNYQDVLRHQDWTDLFNKANYLWAMCYRVIDVANQILVASEEINATDNQTLADLNRLKGEALFLRGMNYFVLNRFWGQVQNGLSVPLQLTPYQPDDLPARAGIEEIKNQVLADLTEAESLMDGVTRNNQRATIYAVKALLARVYFEYEDYAKARDYANDVITNGNVEGRRLALLSDDLTLPWTASLTSENIFTFLGSPIDRANRRLFEMFSLTGSAAVELSMSRAYWNIISKNKDDLRLLQLHEDFRVAWACYKYDDRDMHLPYLRLPEMYLIRAEANVMLGDEASALDDLNTLRARAGLEATTYDDREDLLDMLFRERSLELSMEGDNFHNMKRLKMDIGGFPYQEAVYKLVFFIPEKEVQLNSNIVQNDTW